MSKEKNYFCSFVFMFILNALFPVGYLISSIFGYRFKFFNFPIMAVITVMFSLFFMIFTIRKRNLVKKSYKQSWFIVLSGISFMNFLFYVLFSTDDSFAFLSVIIDFCMILNFVFQIIIIFSLSDTKAKKIVNVLAILFVIIPLLFFSLFVSLVGQMSYVEIVESVPSPNGKYDAQIVNVDQGALGGDTIVQIQKNKGLNFLIFKIEKKPNKIYFGEWGEFETIEVSWENDESVLIDSVRYLIK